MSFIYCKDQRFEQRKCISNVDFDESVSNLKCRVCQSLGVPEGNQELIYHGTVLNDDRTLSSYHIRHGVTVHVLKKSKGQSSALPEDLDIKKLVCLLATATNNPMYKLAVYKILKDAEALDQVVNATPGLRQDIIAMGLLRNPSLMISLAASKSLDKILEEHPCLAYATSRIIASVTENAGAMPPVLHGRTRLQAGNITDELMQMDPRLVAQAELLAAREEALQASRSQRQANVGQSTSQSSIQTADTPMRRGQSQLFQRDTHTAPSSATAPRHVITPGLFSQAIAAALSSTQTAGNTQYDDAIQQIRQMGISGSDGTIRRALVMSDGDIEAAVNLLFEGADV